MRLTVSHHFLPKRPSVAASIVMDHFGIGFETGRHVIAEDLELPIQPGDVVLFTGESGSGKTSLMRAAAAELERTAGWLGSKRSEAPSDAPAAPSSLGAIRRANLHEMAPRSRRIDPSHPVEPSAVLDIDTLDLGPSILVESLGLPPGEAMGLLSRCGLGEARLMLRTPAELSDGQRYRFRLALALSQRPEWIVADEFTATLDRTLARIIAANIRRAADRTGIGFLLATTHADILDDLVPDLHVQCALDGAIRLAATRSRAAQPLAQGSAPHTHPAPIARTSPEPCPASSTNSTSPPAPSRTGRTSLGGITAAIASDSCDS
ncbi:MAG: ATP-binding cassette domain-containing protein [Planctomycetaceae bacterium]